MYQQASLQIVTIITLR